MPADLALVDTNVLVYALYPECEHHAASRLLLDRAQAGEVVLCVVPQILAELFAVVTNPRRVTTPCRPAEAVQTVEMLLSMAGLTLLPVPGDVTARWLALSKKYPVVGSATFDLQLVATMLGNGVPQIYTFNRSHFARFTEVQALTP